MNRFVIAFVALLIPMLSAFTQAGMTVQKKAPVLATKTFDPAAPPKEMPPLSEHEIALTDAGFTAGLAVETQNAVTRRTAEGFEVTLNLSYLRAVIALRVTVWVPKGVTDKIMAHEKGHEQISEEIWATAEKRAKEAAQPLVGQSFTGHGLTAKEAMSDALHQATSEFLKNYTPNVGQKAVTVNNIYDELTAHGTRVEPTEADAIKQAFARYYEENPDAPRDVDDAKPKKSGGMKSKPATSPAQ